MRRRLETDSVVVLRPQRSAFYQGLSSTLAFLVPLSSSFYFTGAFAGPRVAIFGCQLAIVTAALIATIFFFRTQIRVDVSGIAERGFFGRWLYVPAHQIDMILIGRTYRSSGTDTAAQLFICDSDGQQLLRLRGQFWSTNSMRVLAETLEMPTTQLGSAVTTKELLDRYPHLLYWFEKQPIVVTLGITLFVAIGLTLLQLLIIAPEFPH